MLGDMALSSVVTADLFTWYTNAYAALGSQTAPERLDVARGLLSEKGWVGVAKVECHPVSAAKEVRHSSPDLPLALVLGLFTGDALSSVAMSVSALGGTGVASPVTMSFAGISFP
jgi:hypothetical protein